MYLRQLWSAAALSLALMSPLSAQDLTYDDLTDDEKQEVDLFVVDAVLYDLYHEAGHMLVSQFSVPIAGKEEDGVDNLATLLLLKEDSPEADQAIDATAHVYLWQGANENNLDDSDFMDVHSLNKQRAFSTVCLAVGAKPKEFKDLADEFGMPADAQEGCAYDYDQAKTSWDTLLADHIREEGTPPPKFNITYSDPEDDSQAYAAELLKRVTILEILTEDYAYAVEDGINVEAQGCEGTENAWWSSSENTLTYCYPLAESYAAMKIADIASRRDDGEEPATDDSEDGSQDDGSTEDSSSQ